VSCSKVYLHLAESDKIRGIIQNASCLLFSNVLNKKFYMFKYSPQDERIRNFTCLNIVHKTKNLNI